MKLFPVKVCSISESHGNNHQFHYAKAALNTTTVAVSSEESRQKNPKESTKGSKKAPEVQDFCPKSDLNVGNSKVAAAKKPIDDLVEWYKSTRRPNLASYHDLKKVADGNLASSSGDRKRKKVNFDGTIMTSSVFCSPCHVINHSLFLCSSFPLLLLSYILFCQLCCFSPSRTLNYMRCFYKKQEKL